jgi:hypothetical protein
MIGVLAEIEFLVSWIPLFRSVLSIGYDTKANTRLTDDWEKSVYSEACSENAQVKLL